MKYATQSHTPGYCRCVIIMVTAVGFFFSASPELFAANSTCKQPPSEKPVLHPEKSWTGWGVDIHNHRSVTTKSTGITSNNLSRLTLKWTFAVPEVSDMRSQPAVAGNWLFFGDRTGTVRALHSQNGCVIWETNIGAPVRNGTVLAEAGNENTMVLIGDDEGTLHALDSVSGEIIWKKRISEHPHAWITGSPAVVDDKIYVPMSSKEVGIAQNPNYECCTFRGKVAALAIGTGDMLWEYFTVSEKPIQSGTNDRGVPLWAPSGAPVWSTITIDTTRNQLYFGTGQNYTHPWTNESSAIHAVNMDTGRRSWVFQATEGDAWNMACSSIKVLPDLPEEYADNCPEDKGPDFDFGAAPVLVSLSSEKDILVAAQKSGSVYGLDPDNNGTPVWQTNVGRGGMLGGVHWGISVKGETVFVPVSDRYDGEEYGSEPSPGISALNAKDGSVLWTVTENPEVCEDKTGCFPGFSSPVTVAGDVLFAGSLSGRFYAFDTTNGKELWSIDTDENFSKEVINGIEGRGGSIDVDGPVVANGMVYISSGYGFFGQMPGNVLLAFSVEP